MKYIYIEGWTDLKFECDNGHICDFEKVREGGVIDVKISALKYSCEAALCDSVYLGSENRVCFGEASSAIDRAFQLAVSALCENETAFLEITVMGKFVHEMCVEECVKLKCEFEYTIVSKGKEVYEYTDTEKLSLGKKYKELAVEALKQSASVEYKYPIELSVFLLLVRSLKWLSLIKMDNVDVNNKEAISLLKCQCYNNLSHFHLSFGNFQRAISAASTVLQLGPDNCKARYRRAVANTALQNYEEAETDLRLVLKEEPSNAAAKKQLVVISEKRKALDLQYAQAMKKFLSLA